MAGDGFRHFYGSVWTTGHFTRIVPGCDKKACALNARRAARNEDRAMTLLLSSRARWLATAALLGGLAWAWMWSNALASVDVETEAAASATAEGAVTATHVDPVPPHARQ